MLLKPFFMTPRPRNVVTRSKKNDRSWDPDDKRRVNENKSWRADKPEEEAWDIDKERDAIRYKIEHLEALLRLRTEEEEEIIRKMRERIERWEEYEP
jgi:hypothetical protein